jgi:phosphate-selective porin OprO/OprP
MDWDPRPSIVIGDVGRIDLRLKLQAEWRKASPDQHIPDGTFEFFRRRAGIEGTLFNNHLAFQIERELREDGPWRDVFLNARLANELEFRMGKFKIPFGLEQTTSTTDLDFAYRTLGSQELTPARAIGGIAHGRALGLVEYEAGAFRGDGENARSKEPVFLRPDQSAPGRKPLIAGRLIVTPFGRGGGSRPRVGAAFTSTTVSEGLNSLRGRSVFNSDFFSRVYVAGKRTRLGFETEWDPGSVGLRAEYIRSVEQRNHQGLRNVDLSDVIGESWYASATWIVTGEKKDGNVEPQRALFDGGFGAIEIGTRLEELRFRSASTEGPAFTNPRADHIAGSSERVWTSGANWFINKWVRIQADAIRESFANPARSPVIGRGTLWSGVLRTQLVM